MAEALKDQFFQRAFFEKLAEKIYLEYHGFDRSRFLKLIYENGWEEKELKQRMEHASQVLQMILPKDYEKALSILKPVSIHFSGFDGMIFPDFVQQFGLNHYDESIQALEHFTQYSSSEFAIRPFILANEARTMEHMQGWSQHPNLHVRRLSSEGCRPRLPWAMALPRFKKDPSLILPILNNLKADPELYVRKSVANNLNDITKDNASMALEVLEGWNMASGKETKWIIKHALRGLLKAGNPRALSMLGFGGVEGSIEISDFVVSPNVINMGQRLNLSFNLINRSTKRVSLMVDYILYFKKANGSNSPKVFKLKTLALEAGEMEKIEKWHMIKPITTRKYYAGKTFLEIQVNGNVLKRGEFDLLINH